MSSIVRTVGGDVESGALGRVYCHEHLLTRPGDHLVEDDLDLVLDDRRRALAELETFRSSGGGTIVEVTTPEFGRDLDGLRDLSERSGVEIVGVTGHVSEEYWRGVIDLESTLESELVIEFLRDLTTGTSRGTRAGVIKVGSSLDRITPTEKKIVRAAAIAQGEVGAPITTHTTAGTAAFEQVRVLEGAGADLEKVCIGHLDRRLVWDEHLALARIGVFLGYDCISKEKYEPDWKRIDFIVRLSEAGYANQIVLSADMARRSYLESWQGGPGYRYILEVFVDRLRRAGLSPSCVDRLLIGNPARFLTWSPTSGALDC
ncbi:MAG: phosphotriesterase family protein [Actinomycetota bacterium]